MLITLLAINLRFRDGSEFFHESFYNGGNGTARKLKHTLPPAPPPPPTQNAKKQYKINRNFLSEHQINLTVRTFFFGMVAYTVTHHQGKRFYFRINRHCTN